MGTPEPVTKQVATVDDREALRAALDGDPKAVHALVVALTPVVQACVARALMRRGGSRGRNIRQEVEDLTQEVFLAMFRDDQKSLRRWDPALGLSLRGFVGLLAQRRVAEIMRTAKRSPWSDRVATLSGEHTSEAVNPEETALSRQLLDRLLFRLEAMLSPRGYELFVRLYVNEESVAAVSAALNINSNAVHQWKHRLAVAAREALRELGHQDLAERSEGVQPATIAASRPEAEP